MDGGEAQSGAPRGSVRGVGESQFGRGAAFSFARGARGLARIDIDRGPASVDSCALEGGPAETSEVRHAMPVPVPHDFARNGSFTVCRLRGPARFHGPSPHPAARCRKDQTQEADAPPVISHPPLIYLRAQAQAQACARTRSDAYAYIRISLYIDRRNENVCSSGSEALVTRRHSHP